MARNPATDPRIPTTAAPSDFSNGVEPWHTHVGMSDQEIRARALECASRLCAPSFHLTDQGQTLWRLTAAFEHYITKGEKP